MSDSNESAKSDNPHYFFLVNQQIVNSKLYSLTDVNVNLCDEYIMAGNMRELYYIV